MVMSLKKIDAGIVSIARNAETMNADIQTIAVAILEHAQAHGDCTRALRLVQALPKSFRRNLLITWFATYSPIGMNVNTGKVGFHKANSKLFRPFDIKTAKTVMWYNQPQQEAEDLPDTTIVDVREAVSKLVKRLQKKLDDGDVANDDIPAVRAKVEALTALAAA